MMLELIIGHKAILLLFKSILIHVHICDSFDTASQVHDCLENKSYGPWHTKIENCKKSGYRPYTLLTFFTTEKVFSAVFYMDNVFYEKL